MAREFQGCPFERYADDIVAHCDSEQQARQLQAAIASRLGSLGAMQRFKRLRGNLTRAWK